MRQPRLRARLGYFMAVGGVVALTALACDNAGQDRVLGLDTRGEVAGVLFLDRNASRTLDAPDSLLGNVRVGLVVAGTRDTAMSVTTDAAGAFRASDVAVGSYQLAVDPNLLGDSLAVVYRVPDNVVVPPNDTLDVEVGIGYPQLSSLAAIATTPLGRRVVVAGIAQNANTAFGDSTVFLVDSSAALIASGVRTAIDAGDSVRLVGTVALRGGTRVLSNPTPFLVTHTAVPAPLPLSTAAAATANAGAAAGRLARVVNALVVDTASVGDSLQLTVNDGSGLLIVMVSPTTQISRTPLLPAAVLDFTGVLAPVSGSYRLQPRSPTDVTVRVSVLTVAQIRTAALGAKAALTAVALTAWNNFGDSTLFVADGTGTLRAIRVTSAAVSVGDSVRLTGTVATQSGQRVLQDAVLERLGLGTARLPTAVTTAAAAQTSGLDAALVKVSAAAVSDTATAGGDLILTASDGSGQLGMVIDADVALNRGPLVPGAVLDVTGVLTPTGTGQWRLRPRAQSDIVVVVPVVTVATARGTPIGNEIVIVGIALNDRAAFGDQTVHLRDATGSLRATGVSTPVVFAGDSARFRGTVGLLNGQRVLQGVTVIRLTNIGVPAAAAITTQAAGTANSGSLDAGLVRVTNATITSRTPTAPDTLLVATDGSGSLEILLDADAAIGTSPYQVGAVIDATGLLVPTGTGQWRLKPRNSGDVTLRIPVVTVAQARARPVNDTVVIRGVALNVPNVFGDSALHVTDTSSAQPDRSIRVLVIGNPAIVAGDSIVVRGVVGTRLSQPVLTKAQVTRLQVAGTSYTVYPLVTSAVAASAFNGRYDAALVRDSAATITATQTVGSDFIMTVNDGSGPLDVVLDGDIGFNTASYTPSTVVKVTGLLVPAGIIGKWVLKPRAQSDIVP